MRKIHAIIWWNWSSMSQSKDGIKFTSLLGRYISLRSPENRWLDLRCDNFLLNRKKFQRVSSYWLRKFCIKISDTCNGMFCKSAINYMKYYNKMRSLQHITHALIAYIIKCCNQLIQCLDASKIIFPLNLNNEWKLYTKLHPDFNTNHIIITGIRSESPRIKWLTRDILVQS